MPLCKFRAHVKKKAWGYISYLEVPQALSSLTGDSSLFISAYFSQQMGQHCYSLRDSPVKPKQSLLRD